MGEGLVIRTWSTFISSMGYWKKCLMLKMKVHRSVCSNTLLHMPQVMTNITSFLQFKMHTLNQGFLTNNIRANLKSIFKLYFFNILEPSQWDCGWFIISADSRMKVGLHSHDTVAQWGRYLAIQHYCKLCSFTRGAGLDAGADCINDILSLSWGNKVSQRSSVLITQSGHLM